MKKTASSDAVFLSVVARLLLQATENEGTDSTLMR